MWTGEREKSHRCPGKQRLIGRMSSGRKEGGQSEGTHLQQPRQQARGIATQHADGGGGGESHQGGPQGQPRRLLRSQSCAQLCQHSRCSCVVLTCQSCTRIQTSQARSISRFMMLT